jgi:hypothetical protein
MINAIIMRSISRHSSEFKIASLFKRLIDAPWYYTSEYKASTARAADMAAASSFAYPIT